MAGKDSSTETRINLDHLTTTVEKFVETVEEDKKLYQNRREQDLNQQRMINDEFSKRLTVMETTWVVWMRAIGLLTSILIVVELLKPLLKLID